MYNHLVLGVNGNVTRNETNQQFSTAGLFNYV